jgi:NAD(P)-dependent dehydrogenase (short-subunit alcohol dehydrogenase family)
MPGRLADKRCLIVGGTSGIGLAAAQLFLQEGARVAVAGLADERFALAKQTLAGAAAVIACDAADEAQVAELFARVQGELGGLDALFHTAGGSGRRQGDGPLHECTLEGWRRTLDTNLTSVFLSNRAAIRAFQQAGGGVILNVASVLAYAPAARHFDAAAYTASKGGVISLSRLAAARYAAEGIRVNVLAPGLVDTPMAERALSDPAIAAYLRTKQPLAGGPVAAADCAAAAVFLCGDEARHITGAVLTLDGAWSLSEGSDEA